MKILLLILCLFTINLSNSFSQKPALETSIINHWASVSDPMISNNGRYIAYFINDQGEVGKTLVIKSTTNSWQRELVNVNNLLFSNDSKHGIFLRNDTLFKLDLGAHAIVEFATNVLLYKANYGKNWILYKLNNEDNELYLHSLEKEKDMKLKFVKNFKFNNDGTFLLIDYENKQSKNNLHCLQLLSLINRHKIDIWTSNSSSDDFDIDNCVFDPYNKKVAFIIKPQRNDVASNEIWYYDIEKNKTIRWASNNSIYNNSGYYIPAEQSNMFFNATGKKLFIHLSKSVERVIRNEELASVDVWNYKDYPIQSAQDDYSKNKFLAVLNDYKDSTIILEQEKDNSIEFSNSSKPIIGNYLVSIQYEFARDFWWNSNFSNTIYLISSMDGSRKLIHTRPHHWFWNIELSPDEKFVIWYDRMENQYYSYDISNEKTKKISDKIPYPLFDDEKLAPNNRGRFGTCGWINRDTGLLIYDRFDIWQVDPTGLQLPLNITNGYGRKKNIVLGIADEENGRVISKGSALLLAGFNRLSKENGFFKIKVGKEDDPIKGKMEPYSFFIPRTAPYSLGVGTPHDNITCSPPIKATNAEAYLLYRMSAQESPNLYFTRDFVKYKPMSNVYPEKKYNWLTTQLVSWTMPNGKTCQGILYKPEDFDPVKKYPVIFHYYEEKSDGLHMYMRPNLSDATINIPYFVSHGYIIFVPDIYYEDKNLGHGVVNSVLSAVKLLIRFPWVDSTKIGIQGHSFGGYQTNFLVTHSNIFAAACEGSGTSNVISSYGQLTDGVEKGGKDADSRQLKFELGQSYLGSTPWESPDLYVSNSPIFFVDRVTTPLLMWHCKDDRSVPFEQAIEMFLNMRRAGKKVWMLQYDGDGHSTSGKNAIDLDIRMRQFFDYYLKGAPAPIWMTEGIPAKLKKIKTGLDIDKSGKIP